MTKRAICNKGTMALIIEFKTTCKPEGKKIKIYKLRYSALLGTPETRRRGLKTRNARRAFTSNPSFIKVDNAVLIML